MKHSLMVIGFVVLLLVVGLLHSWGLPGWAAFMIAVAALPVALLIAHIPEWREGRRLTAQDKAREARRKYGRHMAGSD